MKIFQKYSLELDVGRYINFAIDDTFRNRFNNGITISFWYKGIGWGDPTKYSYLVCLSGSWVDGTINRVAWKVTQEYITFQWGVAYYKGVSPISYANWIDGSWHHYVGIVSENYMKFYVDGVLIGSKDLKDDGLIGIIDLTNVPFQIQTDWATYSIGNIGEIRIYDRPLTEEEIQYLYNGGHIEDGLVFWLYPNEEDVVLDDDGETVLQVTERINGYVGTAYNGVKLVDGKDIDQLQKTKKVLVVKRV